MELKNSVGKVVDKKDFSYKVEEAAPRFKTQPTTFTSNRTVSIIQLQDKDSLCKECEGFLDLTCIIFKQCWVYLGYVFGMLLLGLMCFYATFFHCIPCKMLSCCIKCLEKSVKKKQRNKDTD